jgi:predicted phage terminase large subunit-like protein
VAPPVTRIETDTERDSRTQRMVEARWPAPSQWSSRTRWDRARERERAAGMSLLPSTPAHLAYAAGNGRWVFPPWLQYLNRYMTGLLLDPGERFLAIEVTVRSGKTQYASKRVPAWYLGMFPDHRVIATTFSQNLSRSIGRENRATVEQLGHLFGISVSRASAAVDDWGIEGHEGGMISVPRGGQIIGRGGNLVVIDDPFKNAKEAGSVRIREEIWEWYRMVRTRLEPGGKIIVIMSRWHQDDLIGRLAEQDLEDEFADHWERIHLPAIAEPAPWEVDENGRLLTGELEDWTDAIGRHVGDPLWPERWSLSRYQAIEHSVGPLLWAGQYQQRPRSAEGDMFLDQKWAYVDEPPAPGRLVLVRRWDLADNEGSGDYAAGALVGYDYRRGETYVLDVRRLRARSYDVREWITATVEEDDERWGKGDRTVVTQRIEQEPGSGGKTVAADYVRDVFAGHPAKALPARGRKEFVAEPLASQQQAGNVYLVRQPRLDGPGFKPADWWEPYKQECKDFPRGTNDDMVDATANAYLDALELADARRKRKARVRSTVGRRIP